MELLGLGEGHKKLTSTDGRIWEMLPNGIVGFKWSENAQPIMLNGWMWPPPEDCETIEFKNGIKQYKAADGRRWEMEPESKGPFGFQWNEGELAHLLELNENGTLKPIPMPMWNENDGNSRT